MAARVVSGGDKLEAALKDISRRLGARGEVSVGFLQNATYPDGKPVAMIAAIQEFGAPSRNIPPRPFFRRMVAKESAGWPALIEGQLKATNYDVGLTLDRVGAAIAGQLQLSIRDLVDPPLKPATVRAKGFEKPLIHTAVMINSISWEVNGEIVGKVPSVSPPSRRKG
jgi:hypothetical protein